MSHNRFSLAHFILALLLAGCASKAAATSTIFPTEPTQSEITEALPKTELVATATLRPTATVVVSPSNTPTPRALPTRKPTNTPVIHPTLTSVDESYMKETPIALPPTPMPTPTEITIVPGAVSGQICGPDEDLPGRTAYFENSETLELNVLTVAKDHSTYSLDLDPGQYIAYAYEKGKDARGGSYSQAVPCGLATSCTDHAPLVFTVAPGQSLGGIDICDWSAAESVPPNPAPKDSRLAGMVYTINGVNYFHYDEQGEAEFFLSVPYNQDYPFHLSIAPDRTRGVFKDYEKNDLFLVDFSTGEQLNLTNTPLIEETAWWWEPRLPKLILFRALREGEGQEPGYFGMLYSADVDGSDLLTIDDKHSPAICSVSPDGRTIAYGSGETGFLFSWGAGVRAFDPHDYTSGLAGNPFIGYPPPLSPAPPGDTSSDLPDNPSISSPSWSPDGKKIVWHLRSISTTASKSGYGIFDLVTRSLQLIHPYDGNGYGGYPGSADWSPDGKWLTLPIRGHDQIGTWLVNASQPEEEYFLGELTYNAGWHPKGKWLAYTHQDEYGGYQFSEVWLIDPDQPGQRISMGESTFGARWSRDGEWLAYTKGEGDLWTSELWLYNPETGERVSMGPSTFGPEWSPDGKWLAYQRFLGYSENEVEPDNYVDVEKSEVWLYNLETGKQFKTSLPPQVQDVDW